MITIKLTGKKDIALFRKLVLLFKEVFEMKNTGRLSDAYIKKLLDNPDFIALAAMDGNNVVGGLTAYIMPQYYGEFAEAYIYDMAVKVEYQRKGIGKKLIAALKKYCKTRGVKTVFVEAHAQDKNAVAFYLSAGGKAEKVMHFNYDV